jgi:hypothetical protein
MRRTIIQWPATADAHPRRSQVGATKFQSEFMTAPTGVGGYRVEEPVGIGGRQQSEWILFP